MKDANKSHQKEGTMYLLKTQIKDDWNRTTRRRTPKINKPKDKIGKICNELENKPKNNRKKITIHLCLDYN